MLNWIYLAGAIALEILATSALKASDGFTKPWPTAILIIGYVGAFYCLSLALRAIPMGVAYGIWSGVGIVVISLIGYFVYKQALDLPAIVGITLILAGTVIIKVFSRSVA